MTTFWQENQVGGPYETLEESEGALAYRENLFPKLYELMPVRYPGLTILDYGCGPGHDTILFLMNGAKHVYYADISWQALQTTNDRLGMHNFRDLATALMVDDEELPRVDHVHCAGALHHMEDPMSALHGMRLALRDGGEARMMVYDGDMSKHTQSDVPITEWWSKKEFIALGNEAGFNTVYKGSYPCSSEWRPDCWAACYLMT